MRKDWKIKNFEDCLEKIKYTNKIKRKYFLESGKFPIVSQEQEAINGYWNNPKDVFKIEKPVIIFGDHTQILKYVDFDFVLGADGVKIIQPIDELYSKFFYYFLMGVNLKSLGYARHYRLLKEKLVLIPPIKEQKRIVSILDEAFEKISKAKETSENNLKNAKEVFESYLQSIFEKKGEAWEEKTLGEVIEIRNGRNQQAVLSKTGKYPVMGSAGNVMGHATDYICEAGTTIIGRKGNISKPIFINERFWNVDTAFGFYPKNELDKKLVYYLCLTINFGKMNRGTTIPSLVKSELQTLQISFPKSTKEQQSIVKKLDKLSVETKKLEAIYQQKLNDLEDLKKAILQKALNGELTKD